MTSTENGTAQPSKPTEPVVDTPALRELRQQVAAEELRKKLVEAQIGRVKAHLPSLDVELAQDTVAADKATTGLTGVAVVRAASQLAEHVAEQAQTAVVRLRKDDARNVRLYVTSDQDFVAASGVRQMIDLRLSELDQRLDALLAGFRPDTEPAWRSTSTRGEGHDLALFSIAALPTLARSIATLPALAGLAPAALGLFRKLTSHSYTLSGQSVENVGGLGFDVAVADKFLDRRHDADVRITRLTPALSSTLSERVALLVHRSVTNLAEMLPAASSAEATAAARLARTQARLDSCRERIDLLLKALTDRDDPAPSPLLLELADERRREVALVQEILKLDPPPASGGTPRTPLSVLTEQLAVVRGRIVEILKLLGPVTDVGGPTFRIQQLRHEREYEVALLEELPGLESEHAERSAALAPLIAFRDDVTDFVTEISTATGSAAAPLVVASNADALLAPPDAQDWLTMLVFARITSAGTDAVIDDRAVLKDRRTVLTGVSAEYTISVEGRLVDCGAPTTFLSWRMNLGDLDDFVEKRPLWSTGVPRTKDPR